MQSIISLDTEKLARRGFQHEAPPTHTHWRNTGGPPPPPRVPTPMNFSKYLTDWLGVSTVELCGWKKRDLGGILRYVRAQKWGGGGGDLLPPPPPWKVGGRVPRLPPPPCAVLFCRAIWRNPGMSRDKMTCEKCPLRFFHPGDNERVTIETGRQKRVHVGLRCKAYKYLINAYNGHARHWWFALPPKWRQV